MRSVVFQIILCLAGVLLINYPAAAQFSEFKITPESGIDQAFFGGTLSQEGSWLAVGAPQDEGIDTASGAAYVFRYDQPGLQWEQIQKLIPGEGAAGDEFGRSVSLSGDYLLIGARGVNSDQGAAYIFQYLSDSDEWVEIQNISASDGSASDFFGRDVFLSGDLALVGSGFNDNENGADAGAVYVFERDGVEWTEIQKLTASDGMAGDQFGLGFVINGDRVVIGAPFRSDGGLSGSGAAYVFSLAEGLYVEDQKLLSSDLEAGDGFGKSVAIYGDKIVIGADEEDALGDKSGAAYVFEFQTDSWLETQKLQAEDGAAGDVFGDAVFISENHIIAGAPGQSANLLSAGAAYIFYFEASLDKFVERYKVVASDALSGDRLGAPVLLSSDFLFAGARNADDPLGVETGAVYAYDLLPDAPALISPDSAGTAVTISPELSWTASPVADSYQLQVATDSAFSQIVFDMAGLTATIQPLGGLDFLTTYYWRVSAVNTFGADTSAVWHFTTEQPPVPAGPLLVSPEDGVTGLAASVDFEWQVAEFADSYQLQVATNSAFDEIVFDLSGITGTTQTVSDLPLNTIYYWRVFSNNVSGSGESVTWSFGTLLPAPDAPQLTQPADGATGLPTPVELDWESATWAESYRLEVSTTPGFEDPVFTLGGITETMRTVSTLNYNTLYYWRVYAVNASDSTLSAVWSFSTLLPAPDVPQLSQPADGALDVSSPVTFDWEGALWAETYRLQVSTDIAFGNLLVNLGGLTATGWTVSTLNLNTTYYWRVFAENATDSTSSAIRSFTTELPAPAAPPLTAPPDGAVNLSTSLVLDWEAALWAETYRVQVALDAGFSNLAVNRGDLTATITTVNGLAYSTAYFWRVYAINATDSTSSAVRNFTTQDEPIDPPDAPLLLLPVDNATEVSIDPLFTWGMTAGAETFRLQVSLNDDLSDPLFDIGGIAGESQQLFGLSYLTTFYWRVYSINQVDSTTSAIRQFTTLDEPVEPPGQPALIWPGNGTGGLPSEVTFRWSMASGTESYGLVVALNSNLINPVYEQGNITDTLHTVTTLNLNTTYYWQVQAMNSVDTTESAVWSFATELPAPEIPLLLLPQDGAVDRPRTISFSWQSAQWAETYRLQISLDDGFSDPVQEYEGLGETSKLVSGLSYLTQYFWRVFAVNETDSSVSMKRSFTTRAEPVDPPGAPTLLFPENAATDLATKLLFEWEEAVGAETYRLQVDLDDLFDNPQVNLHNIAETGQSVSNLNFDTRYYWRVFAINSIDSTASETREFTTLLPPPAAAQLLSPANGLGGLDTALSVEWQAAQWASHYRIQVALADDFLQRAIDRGNISTTTEMISGLIPGASYYWRIYAINSSDSTLSDTWQFTTGEDLVPPSILSVSVSPESPRAGEPVTIHALLPGTDPLALLTYGKTYSDGQSGNTTIQMSAAGGEYQAVIPGAFVSYEGLWFRIDATNGAGEAGYPQNAAFIDIPIFFSDFQSIAENGAYADGLPANAYNSVALPFGAASVALTEILGEQKFNNSGEPTNWAAYRYADGDFHAVSVLGDDSGYFLYHTEASPVMLMPTAGEAITHPAGYFASRELQPGWNLLQWPYSFAATVSVTNPELTGSIWQKQNGNDLQIQDETDQVKPYAGLMIFNKQDTVISAGSALTWTTGLSLNNESRKASPSVDWRLRLMLSSGFREDFFNFLGVSKNASNGPDFRDEAEPVSIGKALNLYLLRDDNQSDLLSSDIRSAGAAGHVWNIGITTSLSSEEIQLTWESAELPPGIAAVLIDLTANKIITLTGASAEHLYEFRHQPGHRLQIVAGHPDWVDGTVSEIEATLPKEFALAQNFPNPFNPATTLQISVPRRSRVKLSIFDVLGRRIVTLVDGYLETGYHRFQWEGRNTHGQSVGSGIYFYQMQADGFSAARKMMLVK